MTRAGSNAGRALHIPYVTSHPVSRLPRTRPLIASASRIARTRNFGMHRTCQDMLQLAAESTICAVSFLLRIALLHMQCSRHVPAWTGLSYFDASDFLILRVCLRHARSSISFGCLCHPGISATSLQSSQAHSSVATLFPGGSRCVATTGLHRFTTPRRSSRCVLPHDIELELSARYCLRP